MQTNIPHSNCQSKIRDCYACVLSTREQPKWKLRYIENIASYHCSGLKLYSCLNYVLLASWCVNDIFKWIFWNTGLTCRPISVECAAQIILLDKHIWHIWLNKCTEHQFAVLKILIIEHWPNERLNNIQYGDKYAKHRHSFPEKVKM